MQEYSRSLGDVIKRARGKLGLTQNEVADAADIDVRTVLNIEKYKGKSLFVTRENAVELEEDEYYIGDLIGMEVYTDDSEERFGVLKDVMETGANEVYIITSENHGEVLLPAIHECILDIDVEAKKMKVHLMEGLL